MTNLTKKPGRRELAARVCKLASITSFTDEQLGFTREQLVDLTLYLTNTNDLLSQMKERLDGNEKTESTAGR